jgi:hypothetical protein
MNNTSLRILAAALVLTAPLAARAQLLFTLDNPVQSAAPGALVAFVATLQNTDPLLSLNLDGSSFTPSGPATGIDNFLATPPTLAAAGNPGDTFTGVLFSLQIDPGAAIGSTVFGDYTVVFTPDGGTQSTASQNYSVNVVAPAQNAVPEPGTLFLLLGGIAGGTFARRRRRAH